MICCGRRSDWGWEWALTPKRQRKSKVVRRRWERPKEATRTMHVWNKGEQLP